MKFDHDMYEDEMEAWRLETRARAHKFLNALEIGAIIGCMVCALWMLAACFGLLK
jgi:hypothetical protein